MPSLEKIYERKQPKRGQVLGKTQRLPVSLQLCLAFHAFPGRVAMWSLKGLKAPKSMTLPTRHTSPATLTPENRKVKHHWVFFWCLAQRALGPQLERVKQK